MEFNHEQYVALASIDKKDDPSILAGRIELAIQALAAGGVAISIYQYWQPSSNVKDDWQDVNDNYSRLDIFSAVEMWSHQCASGMGWFNTHGYTDSNSMTVAGMVISVAIEAFSRAWDDVTKSDYRVAGPVNQKPDAVHWRYNLQAVEHGVADLKQLHDRLLGVLW